MIKNTAGQKIGAQLVSATDGSAFTEAVTVYVTLDAGTQAQGTVGSGACTHEGNGYHSYAPSQGETNGDLCAFTFVGTGAVPVTVQCYTQVNANVLAVAGTAQTARDLGAQLGNAVPTVGAVADAVWDEARAGHTEAGTFGEVSTPAEVATEILDHDVTTHTTAGTVGKLLNDVLDDTGTSGVVLPQAQADKVWGTAARALTDKADFALSAAGVQAIWEYGTRTLTSVAALAADIASAVWGALRATYAAAGSFGQGVASVQGNVTGTVASVTGAVGSVTAAVTAGTVSDKTGFSLSAAGIDSVLDEQIGDGTLTLRQCMKILAAGLAGKLSGADTTTITVRNVADSADVIVATVDADGNRSAVTVTV